MESKVIESKVMESKVIESKEKYKHLFSAILAEAWNQAL